uniref:Nitrogen regulatory protein P-II n=1 Tax=Gracilinema caldarium TaxID=215591 RepID=A0A7C3I1T9_9SPIR
MIRLELFANRSVEEDLFDAFAKVGVVKHYTKIPVVHGVGSSGPRMGDAIWPEENFALIIWCEEEEGRRIAAVVEAVKQRFPHEGIKLFGL